MGVRHEFQLYFANGGISRVSLYKMEDATSTGLGQNQAEDIAPFTDKKIAYFFLAVKAVNVAAEKRAKEGMTARERLQLAYEIAFLPRRLNGLFRGWLKDPASVTEDELKALDEAAMLHLPLPQGGYASVRALYRRALADMLYVFDATENPQRMIYSRNGGERMKDASRAAVMRKELEI